jgi:hypothetical protein
MMVVHRTMLSMFGIGIRKCYTLKLVLTVVIVITKIHKKSIDHN